MSFDVYDEPVTAEADPEAVFATKVEALNDAVQKLSRTGGGRVHVERADGTLEYIVDVPALEIK